MSVIDLNEIIYVVAGKGCVVAKDILPENLIHDNGLTEIISKIAQFIVSRVGMYDHPEFAAFLYTVIVLAISLIVGFVAKWGVQHLVYIIGRKSEGNLFDELRKQNFFSKVTYILPELTFMIFLRYTFVDGLDFDIILGNIIVVIILFTFAFSVNAMLDAIWNHFDSKANTKRHPLKGLVQLFKGIVWIVVAVISIAVLIDRSPLALLGGLGAFAAVIMLIFKDSILGVVASVQLSEYNTLHIGDWIKVPGTDADGMVVETNLISVKVQNWDKTTTMVPPYSLVSGSFTNYSTMWQSNTRRIMRAIQIDAETVKPLTEEMILQISQLQFMSDYIAAKKRAGQEGKDRVFQGNTDLVGGTMETNLGLFRAYIKMYLDAHPAIDHQSVAMVYTEQMSYNGIPLYIYCFTNTSAWSDYESIQSAIFEHIAMVISRFSLSVFEIRSNLGNIRQDVDACKERVSGYSRLVKDSMP